MIFQVFFKFHDFSMHGTFLVIFLVFHDFQSLWEPVKMALLNPFPAKSRSFFENSVDPDQLASGILVEYSTLLLFSMTKVNGVLK